MSEIPKRVYKGQMMKAEMRITLDVILDDKTLHLKTAINRHIDGSEMSRQEILKKTKERLTALFNANEKIPYLCWFNGKIKNMKEYINFSGYFDGKIHILLAEEDKVTE